MSLAFTFSLPAYQTFFSYYLELDSEFHSFKYFSLLLGSEEHCWCYYWRTHVSYFQSRRRRWLDSGYHFHRLHHQNSSVRHQSPLILTFLVDSSCRILLKNIFEYHLSHIFLPLRSVHMPRSLRIL